MWLKQYTWCRAGTRRQEDKMTKDQFYAFYLEKENGTPHNKVNYYPDEEKNTNISDCPSVHQHYDSHLENIDGI